MLDFKNIKIKDLEFTPYISRKEILDRIKELAIYINNDYENKSPLFISILNGSFMFTSDLLKQIEIPTELKFMEISSYDGLKSTGKIKENFDFGKWINDRHIIILEDIVDSGATMKYLLDKINKWDPASVEVATLFTKPNSNVHKIYLKYVGFEIEDDFIVGYGLDYDGFGRNYPDVYQLVTN